MTLFISSTNNMTIKEILEPHHIEGSKYEFMTDIDYISRGVNGLSDQSLIDRGEHDIDEEFITVIYDVILYQFSKGDYQEKYNYLYFQLTEEEKNEPDFKEEYYIDILINIDVIFFSPE